MNKQKIINETKKFVQKQLANDATGHDYWHVERVLRLSEYIAKKEGADLFTIQLAALLHDVSDHKFHHGDSSVGANMTKDWLSKNNVSNDIIDVVTNIVATISFKAGTNKAKQATLEGMVVQDADRIDALGAIGIARTFAYGGNKNREIYNPNVKPQTYSDYQSYIKTENHTINHFYEKLLLLKDLMNTKTGKKIALKRHRFMEDFLNQFYDEWDANDLD